METLSCLIKQFWTWTGLPQSKWETTDLADTSFDPLYYPKFDEMRDACIRLINTPISKTEIRGFLLCMALDSEEEKILDCCKKLADSSFLCSIISAGVFFPQSEARWQIAELLRCDVENREHYLDILKTDNNAYVRKRTNNIVQEIAQGRNSTD